MTKNVSAVLLMLLISANLFAQNGARMEGMNPSRTNVSAAPSPVSQPQFEVIASNISGRLKRIAADGALILSDGVGVSCYETTGRLRWREKLSDVINGAVVDVAIAPGGAIYVSSANTLVGLSPDTGKPLWAHSLVLNSGDESGPLVVDSNGTVYFHTGAAFAGVQEKLTAVNPGGTRKWEYAGHSGRGAGRPIFSTDESASYLLLPSPPGGGTGTIVGLSAISGEVLFEAACGTPSRAYAFSPSKGIYTGSEGNSLLRFSPELQNCSVVASGFNVTDTVAVLNSGLLVVEIALPGAVHSYAAIDSEGHAVWFRIDPLIGGLAANALNEDEAILYAIAPETNELIAVRIASGEELWRRKFDAPVSGVLGGADGNLYLLSGTDLVRTASIVDAKVTSSSRGGVIHALTSDTTPPSVSISSPEPNSTVSGTITVSADASDAETGVAGVQFQLDVSHGMLQETERPRTA
jgi:outer membrane protein assembly factor BamB